MDTVSLERQFVGESLELIKIFAKYHSILGYAFARFQDLIKDKHVAQILEHSRKLEKELTKCSAELVQINKRLEQEIHEREILEKKLQQLQVHNLELQQQVNIDGLTQVTNRRYFDQNLQQELQRLKREQKPISLILLDVDYFKAYNDFYGHQAGDDCLIQVAQVLKETITCPLDFVSRYGGEEFAIVLTNKDCSGAIAIAEYIQRKIREQAIAHDKSEVSEFVSLSMGISSTTPLAEMSPKNLIKSADKALYVAKEQGRNRYSIA